MGRRDFNRLSLLAASAALAGRSVAEPSDVAALYADSDALGMAENVRLGHVSAAELLDEAIRRTELINPAINAVTAKHYERARAACSGDLPQGLFTGVPFLLKDLGVTLAGTVTTQGSRLHRGEVAETTSPLVQRYEKSGLVIFGKTNTPEYGMALTTENLFLGDCLNPWNTAYSTGGSSGGAAAAVAAGILPVAHATDGGGSIRVPANHCGVFGFKPTRGRTPGAAGPAMSIGHVVSRSVRDSAAMLDVTAGYEAGAPFGLLPDAGGFLAAVQRPPGSLRVALNLTEPEVAIDPDCRDAVLKTAKQLEELGHRVEEAAPELDYVRLNEVQNILMTAGVATSLRAIERARGTPVEVPDVEPMTVMIREAAAGWNQYDYVSALGWMHDLGREMGRFMENYDIILQPVTATPAPAIGEINFREGDDITRYTERFKRVSAFTHLYNMSGQPSMSLPLAQSAEGLPVGVMLSGRVGDDALLFSLAGQIEAAFPWAGRRPPLYVDREV
ncbi:MAG: amidase [Pseudomonadota bacterium]